MERQYVAIDLHRLRSLIVREDEGGNEVGVVRIDNDPVALAAAVADAGPEPQVAIEATYGWDWAAGETCWDVFYTFSTDGGRSWAERNIRVSDRSMNKNEGYALNTSYDVRGPLGVASANDAAHFSWPDSRAGHPAVPSDDAYFASVVHDATGRDAPTVKASSVTLGAALGILVAGFAALVGSALVGRRRQRM